MARKHARILLFPIILNVSALPVAGPVGAQQVTPLDVWLACKHPASLSLQEISDWGNDPGVALPIAHDRELHYLCRNLIVPLDLRSWRTVSTSWENALNGTQDIPTPEEIHQLAGEALAKLTEWETFKASTRRSERWVRLANTAVYFDLGDATVQPADSLSVRALAAAVREFQSLYPESRLTIHGRTDPTGDPASNLRLASERASNLKIAIVRQGSIDESLLDTSAEVLNHDLETTLYARTGGIGPHDNRERRAPRTAPRDQFGVSADLRDSVIAGISGGLRSGTVNVNSEPSGAVVLPRLTHGSGDVVASPVAASTAPNWALAVTDVIIERAKQDLTVYLVGEAGGVMCKDSSRANYFPTTCAIIGTGVYPPPSMDMVRVALTTDAATVLEMSFRRPKSVSPDLVNSVANQLVAFGLDLAQGQSVGRLLPGALDSMAADLPHADLAALVRAVADLVALYDAARIEIRAPTPEAARQEAVAYALRALTIQLVHQSTGQRVAFSKIADQVMPVVAGLQAWDDAVENVRQLRTEATEVRLQALANALATGINVLVTVVPIPPDSAHALPRIRTIAQPVQDLLFAFSAGEYRTAFLQGIRLYTLTGYPPPEHQRLVALALDFTSAKDEEGMRQALRQFVGHGGGYLGKRRGFDKASEGDRQFITLNSYIGASAGREVTWEEGGHSNNQFAAVLALGLELGLRLGPTDPTADYFPRSISLFVQAVDLGAIAAGRVSNRNDDDIPSPTVPQVLSPGLFLVAGVGRSPLSIGVGASLAPQAQRVTPEGSLETRTASAVRLNMFIAADVPLFP